MVRLGGGSRHGARKSGSRLMEQSTPRDASFFSSANSRQTMDDMVHSGGKLHRVRSLKGLLVMARATILTLATSKVDER
ncbi:unnamed protein product [Ilex paraguariensis]|uniref:Uncharacterized protein n=1 Tax=Ilex paraguariensis TaxID=185542 RepID=A0ABC8SZA3_9AQUA